MGTTYGLINRTRRECIHLNCKYGETINHANFILWLSFEWNKEEWEWVHDNNSGNYPDLFWELNDMTNSYMNEFKDSFWFNK